MQSRFIYDTWLRAGRACTDLTGAKRDPQNTYTNAGAYHASVLLRIRCAGPWSIGAGDQFEGGVAVRDRRLRDAQPATLRPAFRTRAPRVYNAPGSMR